MRRGRALRRARPARTSNATLSPRRRRDPSAAATRPLRGGDATPARGGSGDSPAASRPQGGPAPPQVAAGRVHVRRDPQQSTGGRGRRRTRAAFAFRLAELGPGSLIGVHEFASRTRSEGVFLATEPTLLWRLSFDALDALAARDALAYAAVCRLVAAELCAECDRTKWRLGSILDALHATPLRDPLPRAALRALAAA